jgi:hypothetical protein
MIQKVTATFRNGTLIPHENLKLAENTEVEVTVESETSIPSTVTDPEERKAVLRRLFELMDRTVISPTAPRKFTRDELHERR